MISRCVCNIKHNESGEKENKGIYAFPLISQYGFVCNEGMTLRDYFAAKAMAASISCWTSNRYVDTVTGLAKMNHLPIEEYIAKASFDMADEMLKTRNQEIRGRNSIEWFVKQMELKLRENDHKGGWDGISLSKLLDLLRLEVQELTNEIDSDKEVKREDVIKECADVASFAMMIADNCKVETHE